MQLCEKLKKIMIKSAQLVCKEFTIWVERCTNIHKTLYIVWEKLDPYSHISWGLEYQGLWKVCFSGNMGIPCLSSWKAKLLVFKWFQWLQGRSWLGISQALEADEVIVQVLCRLLHGPVYKKWEKGNSFFTTPSCTLCVGWIL